MTTRKHERIATLGPAKPGMRKTIINSQFRTSDCKSFAQAAVPEGVALASIRVQDPNNPEDCDWFLYDVKRDQLLWASQEAVQELNALRDRFDGVRDDEMDDALAELDRHAV